MSNLVKLNIFGISPFSKS